ncbi:hypothetical protein CANARDRAFT_26041 [[Candida] arabinofermentans NRRL YB-2248]|uniref:Uncharacterized protein n=1 Tax=[Candida] arabinofermentans NRRL YB-2248 TaxID=983967 RepID=A0A1E4T7V3_9ASCO|nr:hypothetical protein CANARDRAFT_26041 [[Candida] arabinofermentans NRRL YB-2248]
MSTKLSNLNQNKKKQKKNFNLEYEDTTKELKTEVEQQQVQENQILNNERHFYQEMETMKKRIGQLEKEKKTGSSSTPLNQSLIPTHPPPLATVKDEILINITNILLKIKKNHPY